MSTTNKLKKNLQNYEVLPPDGGYGYVIATNLMIIVLLGWLFTQSFGLIFEEFLGSFGNAAQHTSIICSIHFTVFNFAGLPTNVLLQKLSYRKVTFLGAFLCISGTVSTAFVTSATQLIFTFGILQGSGQGILYCCGCAQFNEYFQLRKSFVMNFSKVFMTVVGTSFPTLIILSMDEYGFRGTLAIVAAASLHLLFVALSSQPVKWHTKKRRVSLVKMPEIVSKSISHSETVEAEEESLLDNLNPGKTGTVSVERKCNYDNRENAKLRESKVHTVCCIIYRTFDLELFTDPKYINLTLGLALGIGCDGLFTSFLPHLLNNAGFYENDVTILLTVFASFDVIGKVSLCILSGFVNIKNRHLQLVYAVVAASFRLGFVLSNSFGWIAFIVAVLGFVRCLIYNTLPLVFAEIYPKRYITSLSLSMVVNALVVLIVGQIIGVATTLTPNKNVILYILSSTCAIYATTWTIELLFTRVRKT